MRLLFVDTETGGLDPTKHSLLQIGLVCYDSEAREILAQKKINVKHDEYVVTAKAMQINGINLVNLDASGNDTWGALMQVINFLEGYFPMKIQSTSDRDVVGARPSKPIVMVGHNLILDKGMLHKLFDEFGMSLDSWISYRSIDTMSFLYALQFLGKIPAEVDGLFEAAQHFGITQLRPHDALDDCLTTIQVFERCLDLMGSTGPRVAAAVASVANDPLDDVVDYCHRTGMMPLCTKRRCADDPCPLDSGAEIVRYNPPN